MHFHQYWLWCYYQFASVSSVLQRHSSNRLPNPARSEASQNHCYSQNVKYSFDSFLSSDFESWVLQTSHLVATMHRHWCNCSASALCLSFGMHMFGRDSILLCFLSSFREELSAFGRRRWDRITIWLSFGEQSHLCVQVWLACCCSSLNLLELDLVFDPSGPLFWSSILHFRYWCSRQRPCLGPAVCLTFVYSSHLIDCFHLIW